MSGTVVIEHLLRTHDPLLAVVPVARIKEGPIRPGGLPAIGFDHVSRVDQQLLDQGVPVYSVDRVRVTVAANNAPERRLLIDLIRTACAGQRGDMLGLVGVSVLTDGQGPSFYNEQGSIFMRTQDFRVAFNRVDAD